MLNSFTREQNPCKWAEMLADESFDEKVAISTAVIDAGVNLTDKTLSNIVTFTTSLTTLVQILGRKRRKSNEAVRLFVWSPAVQDVHQLLRNNMELRESLALYESNYAQWVDRYIVHPKGDDLRNLVRVGCDGTLHVNSLAKAKLFREQVFLEKLMKRAKQNHGDCGFDRLIAHHLNLTKVNFAQCWLDDSRSGKARADLEALIANAVNQSMDEEQFSAFSETFKKLCVAAYGKGRGGKDRDDRPWGWKKISNKLRELGGQYQLHADAQEKRYVIIECGSADAVRTSEGADGCE